MIAYTSLLDKSSIQKRLNEKIWRICIIVSITSMAATLYAFASIHYSQKTWVQDQQPHQQGDLGTFAIFNSTEPPLRSLIVSVPASESSYYVDLEKYPIEDNLISAFPIEPSINETIREIVVERVLQRQYKNLTKIPWTTKWLSQSEFKDVDTFACKNQPLPYPVLRHLAAEYFPVSDSDSFFDYDGSNGIDFSKPFIFLPYSKQHQFTAGQQVCIRLVVPFSNVGKDDAYQQMYKPFAIRNAEIKSPWWDTTMTTLREIHTNETVPVHLEPWSGHRNLRMQLRQLNKVNNNVPQWAQLRDETFQERNKTHVYEATVTLPGDGSWTLSSLLEFVEARYDFEGGPITTYNPVQLPVFPHGFESITIVNSVGLQREKTDLDLLKEHIALPLCKGFNHPGRWLSLPKNESLIEDLSYQLAGHTRFGKYWAPYSCRYRRISYEQFNRCLSRKYPKGLAMYGDSNVRRSTKKFLSHGNWCKGWTQLIKDPLLPDNMKPVINKTYLARRDAFAGFDSPEDYRIIDESQLRACNCEDYWEKHWNMTWFDPNSRASQMVFSNSEAQSAALGRTEWDDDSFVSTSTKPDAVPVNVYKWDGISLYHNFNWKTLVPASPQNSSVAIFSLGNWDAAFMTLDKYLVNLDYLVRQIKEHYDLTKTKIVLRTAQYYCCRVDDMKGVSRLLNTPRLETFEEETRKIFKRELKAEIWNTYALGESKTWDEKILAITCPSNHVPAEDVDIENQILMNGLCNL